METDDAFPLPAHSRVINIPFIDIHEINFKKQQANSIATGYVVCLFQISETVPFDNQALPIFVDTRQPYC